MTPPGSNDGDLASIAARAGLFLEINYTGSAKDKRIARDFGVSPSMAKMLRGGRGWTVARLDQLLQLRPAARGFIFAPPGDALADRIEQLAQYLIRLDDGLAALRADLANLRRDMQPTGCAEPSPRENSPPSDRKEPG